MSPITATATVAPATSSMPNGLCTTSTAPKISPSRMPTKVPISIRPLPPTSSSGLSRCGRYAYLTGPNSVECTPMPTMAAISSHKVCVLQPTAATPMMDSYSHLTKRASPAFSNLSAIWPAVAENTTYGRMNRPGIKLVSVDGLSVVQLKASKVRITISAVLNRLSLKAPKNWVQKNGAKRRCDSRANWLDWLMSGLFAKEKRTKYRTTPPSTIELCNSSATA